MVTALCMGMICVAVGICYWQRQVITSLRTELDSAKASAETAAEAHEAELNAQTERFDESWDRLNRDRDRLEVENKMHLQYAHVCRECKTHDPVIKDRMERNLRSVTKR